MSVWNGASYYVEVFGRRFEKELLELKRELEKLQSTERAVSESNAETGGSGEVSGEVSGKDEGPADAEAEAEGEVEEASEGEAAVAATGLPDVPLGEEEEEKKDK